MEHAAHVHSNLHNAFNAKRSAPAHDLHPHHMCCLCLHQPLPIDQLQKLESPEASQSKVLRCDYLANWLPRTRRQQ